MKYRILGNTNIKVSEIGFGAWQLGNTLDWAGIPESEAEAIVNKAIELGITFFDTAPNYAGGKSETLLGKALEKKRKDVVICTKFGHFADNTRNFDANLLQSSIENSLKKLKTNYLDCVLLHNPAFELMDGTKVEHYKILSRLKEQGVLKSYGVSVDTSKEIEKLLETTDIQVLEVMYNINYQEPSEAMKKAKEKGVGIIIKVPLDSGWLSGKYNKDSKFDKVRSRWNQDTINRRAKMIDAINSIKGKDTNMVHEALRFVLAHEGVSTVIPGVRNYEQLELNVKASNVNLNKSRVEQYKTLYKNEIGNNVLPW